MQRNNSNNAPLKNIPAAGDVCWRTALLLVGSLFVLLCIQAAPAMAVGYTVTAGSMVTVRQNHTATLLNDGRVLITGGTFNSTPLKSAEIYDPATGEFSATGNMTIERQGHTATRLADGRVLIAGGHSAGASLATAEIFDPAGNGGAGTFTATASMAADRSSHTATLISGTKVLLAGGQNNSGTPLNSAEVFDPDGAGGLGTFTSTATMKSARKFHSATPISGGRVLLAGGRSTSSSSNISNTAEIFDPAGNGGVGTFTLVGALMKSKREVHTATLLSDGRVLIAGGYLSASYLTSAEIFDPAAGTFTATTSPMSVAHYTGGASRLPSGNVLVAGGFDSFSTFTPSVTAELFNPATGSFTSAGTMNAARDNYTAVALDNGTVLLAGGNPTVISSSAEIYNPASIGASPAAFTFEDTFETFSSPVQVFTISNTGSTSLQLNSIVLAGAEFSLTSATCAPPQSLVAGGSCTVSIAFTPAAETWGPKSATLTVTSSDPELPTLSVPLSGLAIALLPTPTITVHFAGTGAGSVSSALTGLNCQSSPVTVCQVQVYYDTPISLFPAGTKDSLFNNWASTPLTVGCSGGGTCAFSAEADTSITATFDYIKPARIGSTLYDSLQNAYAGAFAGVGNVIEARTFTFTGPLDFDQSIGVTLKGGYDLNYAPVSTDYSTVNGAVTVSNSSVTLENMIVNGKFTIRNVNNASVVVDKKVVVQSP